MDPSDLLAPISSQPLPAEFGVLLALKFFGFLLHMVPMHLWYGGLPLAALLARGGEHGRRLSARLGRTIPVAIALGINFGLVPLLFSQVIYSRATFVAGILMAWPWLAVIPFLLVAYACTYVHALQAKGGRVGRSGRLALTLAALLMLVIGFLFTNHLSLMTNVSGWEAIHARTSVSGAVTGLALNTGDPTLVPRWLAFFCFALMSTAVWIAIDAILFASDESEAYRAWALRCARLVFVGGALGFGGFGTWYTFALPESIRVAMTHGPQAPLFAVATAMPFVAVGVMLYVAARPTRRGVLALVVAQGLVMVFNAGARQWIQHAELGRYGYDPSTEPASTEISPIVAFVVAVLIGVAVMAWALRSVAEDLREGRSEIDEATSS